VIAIGRQKHVVFSENLLDKHNRKEDTPDSLSPTNLIFETMENMVNRIHLLLALLFCSAQTVFQGSLRADDFLWTGDGDGITWTSSANWTRTAGTGTNGFPESGDSAVFNEEATIRGGNADVVTISSDTTLTVGANFSTGVNATITNEGTLAFQADNSNNNTSRVDTRLLIDSEVTLSGGGDVVLNGIETGFEGPGTLNNQNNTIRGNGALAVDVVNQSIIRPEGGTLRFTDGSILDNQAGRVEVAASGTIDLSNTAVLLGGELTSEVGGRSAGGIFRDVTLAGTLAQTANRSTTIEGTLTNQGTLTFQADNSNNNTSRIDTRFLIDSEVTLSGGGDVVLNGIETGFEGSGTLINVDNIIRTTGSSQLSVDLESAGSGEIQLVAGSVLDFNSSTVTGETLNGLGGLHREGILNDVIIQGSVVQQANTSTTLQGTLTNEGTLAFQADNSNNNTSRVDTRLLIDSEVTLSGGGDVVLNGIETGFEGPGTLNNQNNTIRGNGALAVDVVNNGTIYADNGRLTFTEDLELTSSGLVDILLNGNAFSGSGNVLANNAIDLTGTLGLVAGESFVASVGDTFRVLSSGALNASEFGSVDQTASGEYVFDVSYGTDFVEVEVVDIVGGSINTNGDFDNDGDVDADDIDFYLLFGENTPSRGILNLLNLNLDGVIGSADRETHITTLAETSNGQVGTFFGDINLDGTVDVLGDAFILVAGLGTTTGAGYSDGDIDGDGGIDVLGDGFLLVSNLGRSNGIGSFSQFAAQTSAIPEPGSYGVLLMMLVAVSARRSRLNCCAM
jgi:hypothetical protein